MPAIKPNTKSVVLVTGATGYIAAWVARVLLKRGHDVRGTVRSESKGQALANEFKKRIIGYGNEASGVGKFEYVVVEDISKPGAFDEAVKGVDAVEHLATPVVFDANAEPREMNEPAVNGTVGVLESVRKNGGGKVKRVVVTSSVVTIWDGAVTDELVTFTDEEWNETSVQETEAKGRNTYPETKYRASKVLAEKAAWSFMSAKQPLEWDLVTIHPSYVFGPITHSGDDPKQLGLSARKWYDLVMTTEPDAGGVSRESLASKVYCWIDVRDLAEAHVRALEREAAGGQRIIISKETYTDQDWLDTANSVAKVYKRPLARGIPGMTNCKDTPALVAFNTNKAKRLLGMSGDVDSEWKYRTMEETAKDVLEDYAARSWLE